MKKFVTYFFAGFLLAGGAFAKDSPPNPWFNGSIFSAGASVNGEGVLSLQPYVYFDSTFGSFTSKWGIQKKDLTMDIASEIYVVYGIGNVISVEATPGIIYRKNKSAYYVGFQDTPFFLGMLLLKDNHNGFSPDVKIRLRQVLPLGKFDNLNAAKNKTDAVGEGSLQTGGDLIIQKRFQIDDNQFLRPRLNVGGTFYASRVILEGVSSYGGDATTSGVVNPGRSVFAGLSGEYFIGQRWGFALDVRYKFALADRFFGKTPETAPIGSPSSQKLMVSPQFEYSFSPNLGLVLGGQIAVAGKNTSRSAGGSLTASYTF